MSGKSELIRKILQKKEANDKIKSDEALAYPGLKRRGLKRGPLSLAQKRIYVLSQMGGPKDIAYNLPEVLRFGGALVPARVQEALRSVIRRHDILRTAFVFDAEQGEILQEVHPEVPFEVELVSLDEGQFEGWLQGFIRPFELALPCQLRCALVDTPDGNFVVFDSHHIIGDGFSSGIINRELAQLYQGRALAEPGFQYLDQVDWAARWMGTAGFRKQEHYWLNALAGPLPVLELPLDFGRPERKDFLGSTVEASLGELSAPLRALFRVEKVTLYTGLLSLYALFLAKLSRQEDVVIGTPVTGRPLPDMQQLPGMFVNTLPIVTRPRADLAYRDFLQQVKATVLACLQHADCDISVIVEKLGIKRNPSRNPLFDTLFVLQVKNLDMFDDAGMGFTPQAFDRQRSQFDLSLEAVERGEEIVFKLDYATALFSRETVLQLRDQLLQLVANLLDNPAARIGPLSLLSGPQQLALTEWQSPLAPDSMVCIPALFDAAAAAQGDKPALILDGQTLGYAELARRVDSLAWHLRSQGIGRDNFVCLLLERSFDMIVAILAVIKAGAAYVPIDPDYPDERISFIIDDCAPALLITQPEVVAAKAALLAALPVALMGDIGPYLDGGHRLKPVNQPADLLYLIYTSGTTGLPKGVMVEHQCLLALLKGNGKVGFPADDRWALFHSYAFDVSVWEIFASLLHGCSLVIVPKKTTRDTPAFWRLLQEQRVTVLNQTPSAFYRFAEVDATQSECLPIRWVNFAGEALLPGRLATWRAKYPATELINMYGITETTIHTSYKNLSDADIRKGECSNIGVALGSLFIYLLDKDMQLCAPGVIGEIYVGGWGVARGYLNRPQLNQERFLADPFVAGRRLYRSGDLAKWTVGGELEYLGRSDQQVKIRGYRIECGEIENRLLKLSGAKAAAVFDKLDERGDKVLCAVVQGLALDEPAIARLKQDLAAFLPGYMIPTHLVAIDEIPLTSNGKLDRRKLAEHLDRCAPAISYIAPQGATETALAQIWAGYFPKAGPIGRAHDFFELGGHSLLAIEMALEIRKAFDKQVQLETLFNFSTLTSLAEQIDLAAGSKDEAGIPRVPQQPCHDASFAQQRLFFIEELSAVPGIAYNVPLVWTFAGAIDVEALGRHLAAIVDRHEALRTTFRLVDGVLKQVIRPAAGFALEVVERADAEQSACIGEFIRPFDLREDLPFRARVVRFHDSARGLLLLDLHHIICDGISLNILIGELTQLSLGQPLRPVPVQFKDFSSWWPSQPNLGPDLDYWLGQLQGAPRLELYTDFARPATPSFAGDEVVLALPQAEAERLEQFCKSSKITAHMAYMAVFSLLLSKLSGQQDLVIGTPSSGRVHRELQQTVGMFVGTMPIRCRPHAQLTFTDYVQALRQSCMEAQDHQYFQLEEVAKRLGGDKDVARNPIFDCMLDLQVADPQELRMPGLRLDPLRLKNASAKMDLLLSIGKGDDGTILTFSYATVLFKRETVETIARCFQVLLGHCLDAPARALDQLCITEAGDPAPASLFARPDNQQRIAAWYWQRQLANPPAPLAPPTSAERARHPLALEAALTAALSRLGQRHGATLDVTLVSAWAALLARLSGQDELLVGLLRFRLAPDLTVAQLLAQGAQLTADAARYALDDCVPAVQSCELVLQPSGVAELVFDPACHDAASIARWAGHYTTLLSAMAADEHALLADLPLLSAAERQQILHEWNATDAAYPQDDCLHTLFEHQAARTPDAIALVCGARELTYAELEAQSNQLAHYLRARGAMREHVVAICLERGIEMVIAILASWKAGAAYLPLDPAYPPERLAHMLADSRPVAIVSHAATRAVLNAIAQDSARIDLDADSWRTGRSHAPDYTGDVASQLAYVIYTSGSTGTPKGIAVEHRSASNLAASLVRQVYGNPATLAGTKVGLNASIAFDASLQQLLMLNYGATLHLLSAEIRLDMDGLAAALAAWQLDSLDITPAQLALLLSAHPALRLPRWLLVGGEAISPALWTTLQQHQESAIFNVYGPTETTVDSILCAVHTAGARPLLGRPLDNTRIYILDDRLQPVPVGVAGELYIGGAGVARGYLHRPELTAERFLPNSFAPDSRMYKTGDLARWRADGMIEYLGRNDFQVKIRGHRIELGEIEARLAALDGVRDAVVLARDEQGLVAYVTLRAGAAFDPAALRAGLAAGLAEHMLPAAFVHLAALPLTANGKVDRHTLPAPGDDAYISQRYEAPQGELEVLLAGLWTGVLQRQSIGRHDNFFALGGHSLLAVQLLSRIRDSLQLEVPLTALFSHPTLAGFAAAMVNHSGAALLPAITPAPRDGSLALSFAQQRLWFLSKMEGVSQAYHLSGGIRLHGALDLAALQAALDRLIARHEALRTSFDEQDGQPMQTIAPADTGLALQQLQAGELDLQTVLGQFADTPFDLRRGPLIRAALVRLAEQEHVLFLTMHHIVSDGWSMGVLINDIGALYSASAALPPLPIQYADYAQWQRRWLGGEQQQRQAGYWQRNLAGVPALLELPADRPRPRQQSYAGASLPVELDAGLTRDLKSLAQRHGATLYMVLLSSWAALLARLSGQDDIVIGSPVAGRHHGATENLIGLFVNTLALRFRLDPQHTVAELLQQGRRQVLDAQQHQDLPFEQVVDIVQPPRSLAHAPIFQVMFAWQNAPQGALDLPGLTAAPLAAAGASTAKFDLSLNLHEAEGRIIGELEYASALFDHATIARHLGHWHTLLAAMVRDDQQALAALPLLQASERARMLVDWNATATPYPHDRCLHQLFERQAAQTPDAVALVFGERQLRYAELNTQADRLAGYLRGQGVGADTLVAICLERGIEMVVALLATLKAGGAYVPLDPAYPAERLAHMLDVSQPVVTVMHAATRELVTALAGQRALVDLDSPYGESDACAVQADPGNLAYVIYTSGSTGLPKGVMITHRNVVNFMHAMGQRPGIGAEDVLLSVTSLSFDIAALELFLPLLCGARIVLTSRQEAGDPVQLAHLIELHEVSMMQATPSTWRMLVAHPWPRTRRPLTLLCGGEALPADLARALLQHVPAIWNMYGPTETTIWSTVHRVDAHSGIAIGQGIANTLLYVLDSRLQPVPVGVAGELHIGGAGVARGYLHRPELTAERFLPDPFAGGSDARMYRTGDLARWRADGTLEYLGRNDFQVKIRGHRIELGEIEARLAALDGVGEAVVVARVGQDGDQRLVAFLTMPDAAVFDPAALRAALASVLAEHMLPAAFVQLPAMPLTPNGKLDRKALPAPGDEAYISQRYEAPQGELEVLLAGLWSGVLQRETIGRHDNFFALGGHSLLAVQLLSRIRDSLQREVPLNALFSHPTLAGFAAAVHEQASEVLLPAITPVERDGPLALSFAQQRLWFLSKIDGVSQAYHLSGGIRLSGPVDLAALRATLNRLVARHEALRTTFSEYDGQAVQVVAPADTGLALQQLQAEEAELPALLARCAEAPFDLGHGPLIRTALVRLAEQDHVLFLTMHHIVSDGWSMGVLANDISALYRHETLPPLPIQYADVAQWQRRWLSGEQQQRQADYWRRNLAGVPTVLALPADRPRPRQQSYKGASHPVELDADLTRDLKSLAQHHGATLYMVLLSSWAALLARLSGQDDIVIGSPVAGRHHGATENLIGLFVNTLALRFRLDPQHTVAELLRQGRNQVLDAQQHQDLPFEQVVDIVQPPRSLAHAPIFQVMFAWQNAPQGVLDLPGLTATPLDVPVTNAAKFDLALNLHEAEGRIAGALEYASALFDQATIARHLGHWRTLLAAMVQDDRQVLAALPLLDAAERARMLDAWNGTEAPYPQDRCLHELIEAQAARTPDAIALLSAQRQLTYAQLNAEANRLAHHLREQGVKPDTLVAICLERGVDMVIAVLATLKAGGAYVPLDPAYPRDRLAFMLDDSAPIVTLASGRSAGLLSGRRYLDLDAGRAQWRACPATNLARADIGLQVDHLAYVIYTSGSTGRPKGVMVQHQGVTNMTVAMGAIFGITPASRTLQFASFSFDACICEIATTLCGGATLVLPPQDSLLAGQELLDIAERYGITHVTLPPAVLSAMPDEARLDSVHTLVVAGEASSEAVVKRWAPGRTLLNAYGPTEITVCATTHRCSEHEQGVPAIGRAVANTRLYILDSRLQPVPVGVAGELYIGGAGVARGYLGRPGLTAERFLPDPFSALPQPRMYKTGDVCRFRADGTVEYLGRNDFQVKVRGFRIELPEIEAALVALPDVRHAAVLARADARSGENQLAAYVVPAADAVVDLAQLRSGLAAVLPGHMIPNVFVTLAAMPLTANGKTDRQALLALGTGQALTGSGRTSRKPQTATEIKLHAQWMELLKLDQYGDGDIGCADDFFELGGTSLQIIRMVSFLAREFGSTLQVTDLFKHRTIEQLAARLDEQRDTALRIPIARFGDEASPNIFCIPGINGHAMAFKDLAGALPGFALQCLEPIDLRGTALVPLDSLDSMCRAYLALVRQAQPVGPYRFLGHSFGGLVALKLAELLEQQGEKVAGVGLIDTFASADAFEPASPQGEAAAFSAGYIHYIFARFEDYLDCDLGIDLARLTAMTESERLFHLATQLALHQIVPRHDPQLVRSYLHGRKVHESTMMDYYRAGVRPGFGGKVGLFKASEPLPHQDAGEDYGWRARLRGTLEVTTVPGNHESLITPAHVHQLGAAVTQLFD